MRWIWVEKLQEMLSSVNCICAAIICSLHELWDVNQFQFLPHEQDKMEMMISSSGSSSHMIQSPLPPKLVSVNRTPSTECCPSSAISPVTVFTDTIHSEDDGYIVEPIFLNIHFTGIITLLPSCIVHLSVDFNFFPTNKHSSKSK